MDSPTIIIDNRSTLRAGFSVDRAARIVKPAVVGYPKKVMGMAKGETLIGDEAIKKKALLDIKYPIQAGAITNVDALQVLWEGVFKDLGVSAQDHAVLVSEPPFTPPETREKMATILFETFRTPAIYLALQPALSSRAASCSTSIVLDVHDSVTYCTPVSGGIGSQTNTKKANLGSNIVRDFFKTSFIESSIPDFAMNNLINEHAYVAADFEKEMASPSRPTAAFELPDGSTLTVGTEAFRCTEGLFQPSLLPSSSFSSFDPPLGLHQLLHQTLSAVDHTEFLSNVVLSGEITALPGFTERITKELQGLYPSGKVAVHVPRSHSRGLSSWLGGSLLASSEQFPEMVLSQEAYEEYGADVIQSVFQIQ